VLVGLSRAIFVAKVASSKRRLVDSSTYPVKSGFLSSTAGSSNSPFRASPSVLFRSIFPRVSCEIEVETAYLNVTIVGPTTAREPWMVRDKMNETTVIAKILRAFLRLLRVNIKTISAKMSA